MKDYQPSELQEGPELASQPTGSALPRFDDWLAERSELWSAGPEIQQEIFAQTISARIGR